MMEFIVQKVGLNIKILSLAIVLNFSLNCFSQMPIDAVIQTKEIIENNTTLINATIKLHNISNEIVYLQLRGDSANLVDYFLMEDYKKNRLFATYNSSGISRRDGAEDAVIYPILNFVSINPNDSLVLTFKIYRSVRLTAFLFKYSYDKNAFLDPEKFYFKSFDKVVEVDY